MFIIVAGALLYFSKSVSIKPYVPESAKKLGAALGELKEKHSGLSAEEKSGLDDFAAAQQRGMSSEERKIMGEINKAVTMERKAPVLEKFSGIFAPAGEEKKIIKKKKLSEYAYVLQLRLLRLHCGLRACYYAAAGFIFIFALLFARDVYYYRAVKFFSGSGFAISRCVMFFLSAAAIVFYLTLKKNLWQECGGDILMPAVVLLAGSSAALKLYDSNFPVYDRLMGSFILPGLSFALIASGI
ncbi:MAG: hypothetical protein J7M11_04220 [Elusimicrobia bacterium]|nr:hypothetical protein [Elusimicrobiota bacterium]